MKRRLFCFVLALSLILTACGKTTSNTDENSKIKEENKVSEKTLDGKLRVVTSIYPVYDLVSKIGGDKLEVVNLTKSGSAHGFEPGIKDMESIIASNLLVINGAGFEGWLDKIKEASKDLAILDLSQDIELIKSDHHHDEADHHDEKGHEEKDHHDEADHHDEKGHEEKDHHDEADHHDEKGHEEKDHHDEEHHHHHGQFDPHIWLSLKNSIKMMETIKNKLIEIDPENKDFYEKNFMDNKLKFEELDKKYTESLMKYKGRAIVVPHEAFGYMARDYGFEQVGIEGINSDSEPNVNRMKEIVDEMNEHKVKTVFYELGRSDKVAKAIANEVGGNVKMISTLEVIPEEEIQKGSDYLSIMEMNLKNIVDSFEGK